MIRRYKSSTMKFRVPLSVPASRYVEHCYGAHGKGFAGCPPEGAFDNERTMYPLVGRSCISSGRLSALNLHSKFAMRVAITDPPKPTQ